MVLGLTGDFLVFIGMATGGLLLCATTLMVGYWIAEQMEFIIEFVLHLMGRP